MFKKDICSDLIDKKSESWFDDNDEINILNEIQDNIEKGDIARRIHLLLSSYNSCLILLSKAESEYSGKEYDNKYHSNSYGREIDGLFSLFNSNECLRVKQIDNNCHNDMFFLLDNNSILRVYSFDPYNSNIKGLSYINYDILHFDRCNMKVYSEMLYKGDPYYCDYHSELGSVFNLIFDGRRRTPCYEVNDENKRYNNKNVGEVLKVLSFDDIYDRLRCAKNNIGNKLVLK